MDINNLLKQAKNIQADIQKSQKEIKEQIFEGQSGGGLVKMQMHGDFKIKKIDIDPSLLDKSEKDMLEDLLTACFNNVQAQVSEKSKNNMQGMLGEINLPDGFKF